MFNVVKFTRKHSKVIGTYYDEIYAMGEAQWLSKWAASTTRFSVIHREKRKVVASYRKEKLVI